MKFFFLLFSLLAYSETNSLLQTTLNIEESYLYCNDLTKLSRKKVLSLGESDLKEHQKYLECKHFKRNQKRDFFYTCKQESQTSYQVRGLMHYGGLLSPLKLPYRYDISLEGARKVISIGVFFKNESLLNSTISEDYYPEEYKGDKNLMLKNKNLLDYYLEEASLFWSRYSPDKSVQFHFYRTDDKKKAHFKVGLGRKAKSVLYNYRWNLYMAHLDRRSESGFYLRTISHEIGHMLGLEDEYNRFHALTSPRYESMFHSHYKKDCSASSLMCTPVIKWTTLNPLPQPHHYYQIFRRIKKCLNG